MPQANNSRQETITTAWAQLTCLRTSRFSKTSRVSPLLAAPTPVHIPHPLSHGTKAGVAVAVILALALVAATAGVWWFLKRRKAAGVALEMDNKKREGGGIDDDTETAQLAGSEKYEVPGDDRYGHELDKGHFRSEAAGTPVAVSKAGAGPPEELEGHSHYRNESPVEMQG